MKFGERKQTQGAQQAQEPWSETAGNAPRTAGDAASNGSEIRGGRGGSRSSGSEYGSASDGENPQAANACGETAEKPKFRLFTGDRVLWIIIAVLAVVSVLVVYSSTAKMAYDAHTARTTAHFLRQDRKSVV